MPTIKRQLKTPCPSIGTRAIHGEGTLLSPEAQTFAQLIAAWKKSGLQLPTHSITINLIFDSLMASHGVPGGRERLLSDLRRKFRKNRIAWRHVWVMERGKFPLNYPQINLLIWLPEDPKFRQRLWRSLVRRLGIEVPPGKTPWQVLNQTDRGNAVCVREVSNHSTNRKSRRRGIDGVADYLVKEIDRNAFEPGMKGRLGDLIGASQEITALHAAAGFQKPQLRLRKIPLPTASTGDRGGVI